MTFSKKRAAILLGGLGLALAAGAGAAPPRPAKGAAGLTVDHMVILMRHGVRPPTKQPPMPAGTASAAWPDWAVPPGWLTAHGAVAIGRIGAWDRARLQRQGLLPRSGCPAKGTVRIVADSDERTIATADAWIAALAPHCGLASEHKPQDQPDPAFSGIENGLAPYDPARADAAVADAVGAGGLAALDATYRPLLDRLDHVLCGHATGACGITARTSGIKAARPGTRPKLTGALDRASTAAQILLLEYADGKPAAEIGWGRAGAADIAAFSAFHALEFRLLARPRYIAAANLAGIMPLITEGLSGPARVTMISGHDTNVANLGGLLDVHWQVPGLAEDDPVPGGALVLERLKAADGALFVRVSYRSQTLAQIRAATPLTAAGAYERPLRIPACEAPDRPGLCPLDRFLALVAAR